MAALDEAQVGRVLPDRQARARRPPRLHRLQVRALARADPLEEVEDQVVDGLGHGVAGSRPLAASCVGHRLEDQVLESLRRQFERVGPGVHLLEIALVDRQRPGCRGEVRSAIRRQPRTHHFIVDEGRRTGADGLAEGDELHAERGPESLDTAVLRQAAVSRRRALVAHGCRDSEEMRSSRGEGDHLRRERGGAVADPSESQVIVAIEGSRADLFAAAERAAMRQDECATRRASCDQLRCWETRSSSGRTARRWRSGRADPW